MGKNKKSSLGRSLIKNRFSNKNKKLNNESFVSFYVHNTEYICFIK